MGAFDLKNSGPTQAAWLADVKPMRACEAKNPKDISDHLAMSLASGVHNVAETTGAIPIVQ